MRYTPIFLALLFACAVPVDTTDGDEEHSRFSTPGKADTDFCADPDSATAHAILALVNDPGVGVEELDRADGAGLDRRAAENIVAARPFETLGDLDDVSWVGTRACVRLRDYACEVKDLCAAPEPAGHFARELEPGAAGVSALSLYPTRRDYTLTVATGRCDECVVSESGRYDIIANELILRTRNHETRYAITDSGADSLALDGVRMSRVPCTETTELGCLVPPQWRARLQSTLESPSFESLDLFLQAERRSFGTENVLPQRRDVFAALEKVTPDMARVVLVGQDPYPTPGHANGLCFSVNDGVEIPASLRTMYDEVEADLRQTAPAHGNLSGWAEQGMLMLNTVLTVRAGEANSHRGQGWEPLTRAIFDTLASDALPRVFVAFGGQAAREAGAVLSGSSYVDVSPDGTWTRIDHIGDEVLATDAFTLSDLSAAEERSIEGMHILVRSAHPAPPFSHRHFLGSRPYTRVNTSLSLTCRASCPAQGLEPTRTQCAACRFDWVP